METCILLAIVQTKTVFASIDCLFILLSHHDIYPEEMPISKTHAVVKVNAGIFESAGTLGFLTEEMAKVPS